MIQKPRILWVGEASFLNSGFAVYGREVISRLHATGKYEFAELGVYGKWNDSRRFDFPWTYYGNLPDSETDDPKYHAEGLNQFGQWKFEETCLDFKPDIVWDIRDWWMGEYAQRSPFRNFYHWAIMPTVDSIPQLDQWIETYRNADSVFSYTEFSQDYLRSVGVEVLGLAPPAADYDIFKPVADKKQHRKESGFMDDIFIVGTVMRNQRRKLYPDLLEAFRKFLDCNSDIAKKTYLYLHTSYPDTGWDIPSLIKEHGLGNKVLMTYICNNCKYLAPSFFAGATQICPRCNGRTLQLPNVHLGVTSEELATIMNWFDLYVQYSICEGFGMPQIEAAGCGIPFAAVNYSAMESVLKNLSGIPIKVKRMFKEPESGACRALPDNDHLVEIMAKFFVMPKSVHDKASRDVYLATKRHYNWDNTAKIWEKHFDSIQLKDRNTTWGSQPTIKQPNMNLPEHVTNEEFAKWIIGNVYCEPSKINSYMALRMIRDLNQGQSAVTTGGFFQNEDSLQTRNRHQVFTRDNAVTEMLKLANFHNYWERRRAGVLKEPVPLFMQNKKKGNI
jgi:glycosyltransferase involved in cell wall biosynthesis